MMPPFIELTTEFTRMVDTDDLDGETYYKCNRCPEGSHHLDRMIRHAEDKHGVRAVMEVAA